MGCFGKGCLTVVIAGFVLLAIVGGTTWYLYRKAIDTFTSTQAAEVRIEPTPTDDQFRVAEAALMQLRQVIGNNQEATVEFSATDLNSLIARDPDFSRQRGKVRFKIADSVMSVDLSTSLDTVPLPGLRGHWFNGTVRLSFSYTLDQFIFDLKSAEARGHNVPATILSPRFMASFNNNFNRSFHNALARDPQTNAFWEHIKTMTLQGDKLVVTTQAR